jgi:hypothetical protein
MERDRRVADVETAQDPVKGIFTVPGARYLRRLQRHDLGPNFYERNYDGTMVKEFLTTPLWGVGTTGPYGTDGRSMTLHNVILRHGGEAQAAPDAYAALGRLDRQNLLEPLNSLILFPPDDTASNLNPGDRSAPDFPQRGHGRIALTVLFNTPADVE